MKTIIILHPTLQRAKWNWERHRKLKWFYPKAQELKLWDIFGNEWDFVYGRGEIIRGHRIKDYEIICDDFPLNSKEIEEILK